MRITDTSMLYRIYAAMHNFWRGTDKNPDEITVCGLSLLLPALLAYGALMTLGGLVAIVVYSVVHFFTLTFAGYYQSIEDFWWNRTRHDYQAPREWKLAKWYPYMCDVAVSVWTIGAILTGFVVSLFYVWGLPNPNTLRRDQMGNMLTGFGTWMEMTRDVLLTCSALFSCVGVMMLFAKFVWPHTANFRKLAGAWLHAASTRTCVKIEVIKAHERA